MISDTLGQMLHDKVTRGEMLSAEQQEKLETWYEQQDELENEILASPKQDEATYELESKIESALAQLAVVANRIQDVATENKQLRQEISILRQQLADSISVQNTT